MTPSIEAAKKLAKILDTTVGYLLGENEQSDLFKDPAMLKRFQDIATLPEKERNACSRDEMTPSIDATKKLAKMNKPLFKKTPLCSKDFKIFGTARKRVLLTTTHTLLTTLLKLLKLV